MINLWEAFQGLLFMATFCLLTRRAAFAPLGLRRAPDPGAATVIPTPRDARDARDEEHENLPTG